MCIYTICSRAHTCSTQTCFIHFGWISFFLLCTYGSENKSSRTGVYLTLFLRSFSCSLSSLFIPNLWRFARTDAGATGLIVLRHVPNVFTDWAADCYKCIIDFRFTHTLSYMQYNQRWFFFWINEKSVVSIEIQVKDKFDKRKIFPWRNSERNIYNYQVIYAIDNGKWDPIQWVASKVT